MACSVVMLVLAGLCLSGWYKRDRRLNSALISIQLTPCSRLNMPSESSRLYPTPSGSYPLFWSSLLLGGSLGSLGGEGGGFLGGVGGGGCAELRVL